MFQNEYVLQVLMWAWSIVALGVFAFAVLGVCEHVFEIVEQCLHGFEMAKLYLGFAIALVQYVLQHILHKSL